MQSLRLVSRGLFSLRTLYARGTRKKAGAGEFQGATRSSGPESKMLAGSLVFLLFVDE